MARTIRYADISTYPLRGGWECAAMVNGYRETRYYYDYRKDEAIKLFYREINERDDSNA